MKLKSKGVLVTWAIFAGPPRNHHSVLCTPMGPLRAVTELKFTGKCLTKRSDKPSSPELKTCELSPWCLTFLKTPLSFHRINLCTALSYATDTC